MDLPQEANPANNGSTNGFTTSDTGYFIAEALDSIKIHFIDRTESKTDPRIVSFRPQMAHQIFGNDEIIYGYADLQIDLTYCAVHGNALLEVTYSSKVENAGLLKVDNIVEKVREWMPNVLTKREQFYRKLDTVENVTGFGKSINTFTIARESVLDFTINLCDLSDQKFAEFHERFQSLIVFFIDAASYIDLEDPNWTILYLYQEKTVRGEVFRLPVGFLTIYKFVTPKITRCRISQVFILPPFQRLGLGTKLLEAAYELINTIGEAQEITVESPSPEFTRLRDHLDLRLLTPLPEFTRLKVLEGFNPDMAYVSLKLFKINRMQCMHLYEILRCYYTSLETSTNQEKYNRDLRRQLKASYAIQCKRRMSKRLKNPACIQTLIEEFDVDENMEGYFKSFMPAVKFLEKLKKKARINSNKDVQ